VRAREFWARRGLVPALLAPLAGLYAAAGALRRRFVRPFRAAVPVICIGALTVGGAGKTPTAIAVATRLAAQGRRPHILTRGYKGRLRGPVRVDPAAHGARDVGDEPLLLAAAAPTWVARNRAAGARAAIAAGADCLVLDDGYQNPGLHKDLSIVVIDGGQGVGNGRRLPAGPLRETVASGFGRADAVLIIGKDRTGIAARVPRDAVLLRGRLAPDPDDARTLKGRRVLAFAGLGRPEKFFDTLTEAGAKVVKRNAYPDHHPYAGPDVEATIAEAIRMDAIPVTTAKDAVRIPEDQRPRVRVLRVSLACERPEELDRLLARVGGAPSATAAAPPRAPASGRPPAPGRAAPRRG
jgi:tetraacyldisaccharide 4'-kinase